MKPDVSDSHWLGHTRRRIALGMTLWAAGAAPVSLAWPAPRLRLACFSLFPFAMQSAAGQAQGITVALAALLSRESGVPIEVLVVPYPRAVAMTVSGECDLMFGFSNPQLQRAAHPLGVVAVGDVVLLGRAGIPLTERADLRGKMVGHARGAEYDEEIQHDPAIRNYETVSYEQTVRMLLIGRLDAALGVRVSLLGTIRQLGLPRERFGPMLILSRRQMLLHYSARTYVAQTAAKLEHALTHLRERGAIAALYRPYL